MEAVPEKLLSTAYNAELNAELRSLRSQFNLKREKLAEICAVSKALVDCWLLPPTSRNFRPMSRGPLRLLKLELGLDTPAYVELRENAEALVAQIKGA